MPFYANPKREDYPKRARIPDPFARYKREQEKTLRWYLGDEMTDWLEEQIMQRRVGIRGNSPHESAR